MKTPLQEFIDKLNNVKPTEFCSIETIKGWAELMLEEEKEVMCYFAKKWDMELGDAKIRSAESCFDETFNTNER